MRKVMVAIFALFVALPVQAAVTIYTDRSLFLAAATSAIQQDFPTPTGMGEPVAPPFGIGNASIFADQMFLYNDGSYGPVVYLGVSGLPGQAGITQVTSGDAFLGLDLGSLFGDAAILYSINGVSGTVFVGDDGEAFLGAIDSSGAAIVAQFVQGPNDELDFLHAYTSDGSGPTAGEVPEPATWAMMIGGLMAVGVALRRQRHGRAIMA